MPKKRDDDDDVLGTEVTQLPMPDHLEPVFNTRALMTSTRSHFFPLYNSSEKFRRYLGSVGNKDSVTKNRMFDRLRAVDMMKKSAVESNDSVLVEAEEGAIYQKMTVIMREVGLSLKLRRIQYQQLTHQSAE